MSHFHKNSIFLLYSVGDNSTSKREKIPQTENLNSRVIKYQYLLLGQHLKKYPNSNSNGSQYTVDSQDQQYNIKCMSQGRCPTRNQIGPTLFDVMINDSKLEKYVDDSTAVN